MTARRQPWIRHDLAAGRCELQILDPATAFEHEREILSHIGETMALAIADPLAILTAIGRASTRSSSGDAPIIVATRSMLAVADRMVERLAAAPEWLPGLFEVAVLGRLRFAGETVETWVDLARLRPSPSDRWRLLGLQLAQTFGELWTRSPYDSRAPKVKDFGVPTPKIPIAVSWAAALAREGYASSANEVLTEWTPLRVVEVVEAAAHAAETRRRADAAALAGGG